MQHRNGRIQNSWFWNNSFVIQHAGLNNEIIPDVHKRFEKDACKKFSKSLSKISVKTASKFCLPLYEWW